MKALTPRQKRIARLVIRYQWIDFPKMMMNILFMLFIINLSLLGFSFGYYLHFDKASSLNNLVYFKMSIIFFVLNIIILMCSTKLDCWIDRAFSLPQGRSELAWTNFLVEIQLERARDYILGDPDERYWILSKVREAQEKDDAAELKMILDTLECR